MPTLDCVVIHRLGWFLRSSRRGELMALDTPLEKKMQVARCPDRVSIEPASDRRVTVTQIVTCRKLSHCHPSDNVILTTMLVFTNVSVYFSDTSVDFSDTTASEPSPQPGVRRMLILAQP